MTTFHIALGTALIVVNALAGVLGGVQWWRGRTSRIFWPLLRAGQVLVAVEALDGAILVLQGDDLPPLHLIYGLVPLAVSFVAEQLRLFGRRRSSRTTASRAAPTSMAARG